MLTFRKLMIKLEIGNVKEGHPLYVLLIYYSYIPIITSYHGMYVVSNIQYILPFETTLYMYKTWAHKYGVQVNINSYITYHHLQTSGQSKSIIKFLSPL